MVVTATRVPQSPSTLVSDITVIDAGTIRRAGNQTLLELLQSAGGVEIATTGGPGQPGAVFLRGTNANHVVVLVDGVRVGSGTAGTTAFENLPLAQVERIEILRGPASALYGADAIGGVIQIFTRAGGNRVAASAGAGTWRTERYAASVAREVGLLRIDARAGYESSDAFSATNARNALSYNPDRDPYRNRNAGGGLAYAWLPGHTLAARGFVSEGTTHFDAGPDSDDVNRQRLSSVAVESRDRIGERWTSTLRVARGTDDLATSGSFPSSFRTDQDQATWQNDIGVAGGVLTAGFEYRRERVTSTTEYSSTSRHIDSIFAGYSGAFGPHLVQAAVRTDDNSQFGQETTGNVGYGYRMTQALRISATAGTAFKAPTFNDLYYVSPFFSGNPDLRPERSRSAEAAVRYDDGRHRAGLTVFENRIRDLIAVDPTFTTVINVDEARIRGATLSAGIVAPSHRIEAELTRQDPVDVASGNLLVRRAKTFGTLRAGASAAAWRLDAEVVASGERFDGVSNAASSRLAGYALVNLRAAYALAPRWTASLRWNNVLDRPYELVRGYDTPRSNVFAMLEYAAE
jgi:vitamin B12 transporter